MRRVLCSVKKSDIPSICMAVEMDIHMKSPNSYGSDYGRPGDDKGKEWHCLDVRRAVNCYIDRSKLWRKSGALFFPLGDPPWGREYLPKPSADG